MLARGGGIAGRVAGVVCTAGAALSRRHEGLCRCRFTQTQEREAEDVGLRYAFMAGYDPRAAADMTQRLAAEVPDWMSAGYFASHLSSVERTVFATREIDDLPSGTEASGEVAIDSKVVVEVATESTVTAETPLVVVDEGEPGGESGFLYAPEPIVIVPFLTGHHPRHPGGRVMHDRVIRHPVPPRPLSPRSSMHTRVVR